MFMEGKELADSVQQTTSKVKGFIDTYQALTEMENEVPEVSLNEYVLPKLTTQWFTYHRKKDKKTGQYLDDGKCRCCDKDRQYLLIKPGVPPICYRCYQAARGYKNLLFDPLHLKSKRDLTVNDCKRIVKYMNTYSKKKLIALAAVGAYLYLDKKSK